MDCWLLELKLVRPDARYWLCTRGLPEARFDLSEMFVVGYVLPERRLANGTWEEGCPYGPHEVTFLQGIDYCCWLREQLRQLVMRQEGERSGDVAREIAGTLAELRGVRKVLFSPQPRPSQERGARRPTRHATALTGRIDP
jgi:hypothetical protein